MATKPVPAGYHSITPSVVVDDAAKALQFYHDAFGAKETYRLPMGEKIGHAEIQIGDSRLMLSDEMPKWDALGPKSRGGATGSSGPPRNPSRAPDLRWRSRLVTNTPTSPATCDGSPWSADP